MLKIIKKKGQLVKAYRLGEENPVLDVLIRENRIKNMFNGTYEVFSQEAVKSESGHGQVACTGDWIRIDGAGFPYPCKNEWFQENYRHVGGDDYEQIPKVLLGWTAEQKMCPEVEFLIQNRGLILDNEHPDKFFQAILWGNPEAAAKDAILVFYDIVYEDERNILDVDYNFVEKREFERIYDVVDNGTSHVEVEIM